MAGRRRAIVLACGEGAVLSHRSAAGAWGIRPAAPVRVHRHPTLRDDEVTVLDGVPITTVARTLLDISALVPPHHLRRAIEEADRLERFDLTSVRATLAAHPRRPGRRKLITLLAALEHHGVERTRSDVEADRARIVFDPEDRGLFIFLQLCLDHDLPRPRVNRVEDGRERDFAWPDLVVEIDGFAYHHTRRAFREDRARDRALLREGRRVARFTAGEVTSAPGAVAEELRDLLKLK